MHRVRMVKHFGVTPYMVFDGDFLPSKARTEASRAKRREDSRKTGLELLKAGKPSQAHLELQKAIDVTPEMARQLIEELKKENIPYVVAPYEADAQLVYLERHGFTSGSISEDSDLLVFGAKRLLTKMDQYGQCVEINRRDFCGVREISLTGWSDDQFRQMAIFSGCDYLDNIGNMGLKTAYRMMRKHKTPDRVIRMLQFDGKFRVSENYLAQYKQAELTFLHQRVFCPKKQEVVLLTEPNASSTLDIEEMPYIGARVDPELAKAIASGDVNPITKEVIEVSSLPNKQNTRNAPRLVTATSGLGRPAPGKPIDEYFKEHRRIPMGEMDRNCFAVDPERVAALTQNGLTPRVFPLPRPYLDDNNVSQAPRNPTGSTLQRRRTEPVSRTLRSLDPSFDPSAPRRQTTSLGRRVSDADPRPPKKARLCEDDPVKDSPGSATQRSKFFPRAEQTEDVNLMSDDAIEEALASLPDISGEWVGSRTSGSRQTLQIFQDETATEMTNEDQKTKDDGENENRTITEHHEDAEPMQDQSKNNETTGNAPGRSLRRVLDAFAYTPDKREETGRRTRMTFGLPTPASSVQKSQPRQMAPSPRETPLQTPLQRIGATAMQKKRTSFSPVTTTKMVTKKRSSLAETLERFPINPAFVPLPKVDLAEVEALNKSGGSEDQILPDSDEENDPPAGLGPSKLRPSRRLDLSAFAYS